MPVRSSYVPVSVVIATYNRCKDCKQAAVSALNQEPPPMEILVCDDGSTDATQAEFSRWQAEEPRLHYLRIEPNRGTPGPARNLGIAAARGEWIAFLDDDDRWRPGKLASQLPLIEAGADVIATDAIRSNGYRYTGVDGGISYPTRADVERANPIILSSGLVRRSLLLDAKGFDESPALAGVEDYDLWLRLADRGARFAILDAVTVDYCDVGESRLSNAVLRTYRMMLRVRMRRWREKPADRLRLRLTLHEGLLALWLHLLAPLLSLRQRHSREVPVTQPRN